MNLLNHLLSRAMSAPPGFVPRFSRIGAAAIMLVTPVGTAPRPSQYMHVRSLAVAPGSGGAEPAAACAVLDAAVYAHDPYSLQDLRLFPARPTATAGSQPPEIPYVVTTSETSPQTDDARVLNLGMTGADGGGHVSFDLAMPDRPYTEVDLNLAGTDFIATAKVYGLAALGQKQAPVSLGTFTLFDLSSQHLFHSTSLPLRESTFPYLHLDLEVTGSAGHSFKATPAMVAGATIPPAREAQTLYTPVAETTHIVQRGHESVASFQLQRGVPVERIEFELKPGDHTNFSRAVKVVARAKTPRDASGRDFLDEQLSGQISQVRVRENGRDISLVNLAIPATIGLNQMPETTLEVAVENGDDQPVPLQAVRLAMRQRKLCFDAAASPVSMYYDNDYVDAVHAPVYDYARLFQATAPTRVATLGPEQANAAFEPAPAPQRTFLDRYPQVLWAALLAAIAVLGAIAFRSAKKMQG
jgi:hypothetical protein